MSFCFNYMIADRLVNPSPINASPRSSVRSSKTATPPTSGIIIDALNVSPKAKAKELENNNSAKIINKNSTNVSKMQKEQMLQQIIDQQTAEQQKQMMELLHANKSVEALGVLVQHLVFNVSIKIRRNFLEGIIHVWCHKKHLTLILTVTFRTFFKRLKNFKIQSERS